MTNTSKVQKLVITAFITVVMAFLFLNLFTVQAHAAGLLDERLVIRRTSSAEYPIDNYQRFMLILVGLAAWNWLDGIGKKRRGTRFTCLRISCGR